MNIKGFLCLAMLVIAISSQAQDLRVFVNAKGKVGYADSSGNEVIKCQYESGQPFNISGTAIVSKSGKYGIIDSTGVVRLPLKYTQITPWNAELYLIKSGKKMGLADHNGSIVLPANYSYISRLNCYGRALIAIGGKATQNDKKTYMANAKYGIIDSLGNILIDAKYRGLYEFSNYINGVNSQAGNACFGEGLKPEYSYHNTSDTLTTDCSYLAFNNNGYSVQYSGIVDGAGNEILNKGMYSIVMKPQNGMVRYYIFKKKQTLCGYYDIETGNVFETTQFDCSRDEIEEQTHGDFTGDIAPVRGASWSFIDKSGKIFRSGYDMIKYGKSVRLWAARNSSGTWDVFDESNSDISCLSGYDEIIFPVNDSDVEIFCVSKNGKFGGITREGDTSVPFEYDEAFGNCFDMIAVRNGEKYGIISPDNNLIVPIEYSGTYLPSEKDVKHVWVKKTDDFYYHFNISTQKASVKGFRKVTNFKNGIAHVIPEVLDVEDNALNRAQLYQPNASTDSINSADVKANKDAFGYLLNSDDVVLVKVPVSTLYYDAVSTEVQKYGGRALTDTEQKRILLKLTRENRSYALKSTLGEDEWDY